MDDKQFSRAAWLGDLKSAHHPWYNVVQKLNSEDG
jgi:hypothetical protein